MGADARSGRMEGRLDEKGELDAVDGIGVFSALVLLAVALWLFSKD